VATQFLQSNDITHGTRLAIFSELFTSIHDSAQDLCEEFYRQEKRRVYLTPKTFLDTLEQYKRTLSNKQAEMDGLLLRLVSGINKLNATYEQIAALQIKLTDLVPKLQQENQNAKIQAHDLRTK